MVDGAGQAFISGIQAEEIDRLELAAFKGEIHVIDRPGQEMDRAVTYLRKQKVIGFDTESRPCFSPAEHSYGEALLQLSGEKEAFLFRLKLVGLDSRICDILADPGIVKVGAAVNDDVRGLMRYGKFQAAGFVDLQKVVWEYGIRDKSVKKMAAIILGVRISKTQQLSNWEAPHLSDSQLLYAATDAWVCREMYFRLLASEKNPLPEEEQHQGASQKHIEEPGVAGVARRSEAARQKQTPGRKGRDGKSGQSGNPDARPAKVANADRRARRRYFRRRKRHGRRMGKPAPEVQPGGKSGDLQ